MPKFKLQVESGKLQVSGLTPSGVRVSPLTFLHKRKKDIPKDILFSWRRRRDSKLPATPLAVPKIVGRSCSSLTILTAAPTHTPCIRHRRRSCSLPAPSSLEFKFFRTVRKITTPIRCGYFSGAEGETRTLAPVSRPTPLAGAPRHQLEYFCIGN